MKKLRPFPYEAQRNRGPHRRCAAAALVMVYRFFDLEAVQERIHEEMGGSGRTYRIARHAADRGFEAAILRFSDPWAALCRFAGEFLSDACLILNHRPFEDSVLGHFSVLTAVDPAQNRVVLHDPQFGPDRCLEKDLLLRLWTPFGDGCEIRGRIAVAIRKSSATAQNAFQEKCAEKKQCGKTGEGFSSFPETPAFRPACPRCAKPVPMQAFVSLLEFCDHVFCPSCDFPQPLSKKSR